MVQQNEIIRTATDYANGLRKAAVTIKWHERDQQRVTSGPAKAATSTGIPFGATQAMKDAGIKSGVETIKAARQARLKELFEAEAQMYEEVSPAAASRALHHC